MNKIYPITITYKEPNPDLLLSYKSSFGGKLRKKRKSTRADGTNPRAKGTNPRAKKYENL